MTTQPDRRIAARRAAAPSVDFSLLPRSPEIDALRALADEIVRDEQRPADAEAPSSTELPSSAEPPARRSRPASPVAERFAYRVRPRGERTLQPMDAPIAHRLGAPRQAAEGASAFVAAHIGATPTPAQPALRQSQIPTLILDRRRGSASPTLEPVEHPTNEQTDDEPTSPPRRGGNRRSQRLDTDLVAWLDDEPSTLGGAIPVDSDVDPELDDWLRHQSRRRAVALTGVIATMIALCAAAMAGVVVMAGPMFTPSAPAEVPALVAPPPAPAPVVRALTVKRGDTFVKLLAGQPVDPLAVHAAALPLHDLALLEIGDTVIVELDPAGQAVREVRYDVEGAKVLVVRKGADGWTATVE